MVSLPSRSLKEGKTVRGFSHVNPSDDVVNEVEQGASLSLRAAREAVGGEPFLLLMSDHVLSEVAHRLMTLEATNLFGRPLSGMANWLRRHPAEFQRLTSYRTAIDEMTMIPISILPVGGPQVSRAADFSIQHGLLSGDALVVAVMQQHGLTHLASHDADFDRVPGFTRYSPV